MSTMGDIMDAHMVWDSSHFSHQWVTPYDTLK